MLSIMPKIREISVLIQMEWSVSVSSDWNFQDHHWKWSTYFVWNISTKIRRSIFLINTSLALIREFGKETKSGKSLSYWLAWFNQKCCSIFLWYCHRSLTGWFGKMESTQIFHSSLVQLQVQVVQANLIVFYQAI